MLVRERMTRRPITVSEDTSVQAALQLMREEKVRRFPVVDRHGKLVGMVAEKDLLYASPSPATSLSIHEIAYLLSKVTVKQVMATDVVTINDDTPLEEAARILADNRVGAVPVMREGKLVGIITETDLFKIFLEMFGAREEGVRLTISVPEEPGMLARISSKIARACTRRPEAPKRRANRASTAASSTTRSARIRRSTRSLRCWRPESWARNRTSS